MQTLKLQTSLAVALLLLVAHSRVARAADPENTVKSAAQSLTEIMSIPASGIPANLLRDAEGVAIIPGVIKAGFVVGGRRGHGVVLARDSARNWTNPLFVIMTGGSVGWQIGVQSTDIFLVFRTKRSLDGFVKGRKFTLGADAAVAAGPVGRQAEAGTDERLRAEILSYSRSRGLFAGVSLEGSVIEVDFMANAGYYRMPTVTPDVIISGQPIPTPASAVNLRQQLLVAAGLVTVPAGVPAAPGVVVPAPGPVVPVPAPAIVPGPSRRSR